MDSPTGSSENLGATFFDFVKRLAETSLLIGASLFVLGWSYLYGYYSGFGLSTDDLGFSTYHVIVHSIPVLLGTGFIMTAGALVLAIAVSASFSRIRELLHRFAFFPPLAAIVALLFATHYAVAVGRDQSLRDSYLSTTRLPYVSLEGEQNTPESGCALGESNYHFLLRSNGHVFVILPIDDSINPSAPNLRICSFPDSKLQAIRIQVGLPERRP